MGFLGPRQHPTRSTVRCSWMGFGGFSNVLPEISWLYSACFHVSEVPEGKCSCFWTIRMTWMSSVASRSCFKPPASVSCPKTLRHIGCPGFLLEEILALVGSMASDSCVMSKQWSCATLLEGIAHVESVAKAASIEKEEARLQLQIQERGHSLKPL